jgi:hypothetical protein
MNNETVFFCLIRRCSILLGFEIRLPASVWSAVFTEAAWVKLSFFLSCPILQRALA